LTSSSPITMNGTLEECLCAMVTSSNISALNYFSNNTCQLFSNASVTNTYFSWKINTNSLFYFLRMPSRATQQYTTTTPVLTTSAVLVGDEQTSTYLATADCSIGKQNIF
jgi:hypothetical protein